MKHSNLISELHNSTKAILIACSLFLVITASVLLFLMLYPIKAKDNFTNHSVLVAETTVTTTTMKTTEEFTTTTKEPPHTLSTWEVSFETIATTEKPDPTTTAWYDAIFTKNSNQTEITISNTVSEIITEPAPVVTEPPVATMTTLELIEPVTEQPVQTITETVTQPVTTEPPVITEPPVVITDPPVTAPITDDADILDTAPEYY